MKKILSFLLVFLLIGIFSFTLVEDVNGYNTDLYTTITLDSGVELTYRNSNEKVLRLKEFDYPTQELRAAWVSHLVGSMPSYSSESKWKSDYTYILDVMQEHGLNCIIFHVRTHNNAFYPSEYNPVASWMRNCDFESFDPLKWTIEETHRRGMEFHAWLNPYRIADSYIVGDYPESNPASDEANILFGDSGKILDPGLPNVREFLVNTCMEVVENYDVDAIHFDDYFYISGADDTETRKKYNTEGLSTADFRRKQVDIFIENLHNELAEYNKTNNKCVQLGISPSGVWLSGDGEVTYDNEGNAISNGSNTSTSFVHYGGYLFSDTVKWINEEWIDYIMPQMYWGLNLKTASFAALTQWWSKIVKYKDVNLYCGLGIYMAAEGSSGWPANAENEIEDQLLNAAMYEEIGGISLYSYNYIKNSHKTIVQGMNLIKNDYYKKYVPCDVKKAYSDMPTIIPKNVKQTNNVISWDADSEVRGYMVYKVDQGVTVDINNYDHLYTYTPNASIEIDDLSKDYYIATVNKANVVSNPIKVGDVDADADYIISLINNLPENITIEDKESIYKIKEAYDSLSISEKANVHNYNELENALNVIDNILLLEKKVLIFIDEINKHIPTNRKLPVLDNMVWSYVDEEDSSKYDIESGERIKNYLNPHYIKLKLTVKEEDYVYSKEVDFNIGILDESNQGLFYRSHTSTVLNDASAMSKDEIGDYKDVDSKYIGWSGVVFEFNNNALFIAEGNYNEIKNVDDNIGTKWTSVSGVVSNVSGSSITFLLTDLFDGHSSGDDTAIIISNNSVKEAFAVGTDYLQTITLENGEILVLLRYLDYLTLEHYNLENTNWLECNVKLVDYNNFNIVENELQLYKNYKIAEINNCVDLNNYSEQNKIVITDLLSSYIELINNSESTDLVDQYATEFKNQLSQYKTLEEEAKEDFESVRSSILSEVEEYQNSILLDDYLLEDQITINTYFKDCKKYIEKAETVIDLKDLLPELKANIGKLKTIEELYADYIVLTEEQLITFISSLTAVQGEIAALNQRLEGLLEEIELDKKDFVENKDARTEELKTNLLNEFKTIKIAELSDYVDLNLYSYENQKFILEMIKIHTQDINNSTTAKEIYDLIDEYKSYIDNVKTIEEEKVEAKQNILNDFYDTKNSININNYLEEDQSTLSSLFDTYEEKLKAEDDVDELILIFAEFKLLLMGIKDINQIYENIIIEVKDELIQYYQTFTTIESDLNILNDELNKLINESSNDKLNLINNKNEFISLSKNSLFEFYKVIKITEITSYIILDNYSEGNKTIITAIINSYKDKINNSLNSQDINENITLFKNEVNNVPTIEDEKEECYLFVKEQLESYIETISNNEKEQEYLYELLNTKLLSIDKDSILTEKENIINLIKSELDLALNQYKELITVINNAINEVTNYTSTKDIKGLIDSYKIQINDAETIEEVERLLAEFKLKVEEKEKATIISCEGCNSFMILELISLLGLVFIFRKKYIC